MQGPMCAKKYGSGKIDLLNHRDKARMYGSRKKGNITWTSGTGTKKPSRFR